MMDNKNDKKWMLLYESQGDSIPLAEGHSLLPPLRSSAFPPQPLHCLQLSAYRLQKISCFAAFILRLCRGPFDPKGRRFIG
ncbi:hypothetical protein, partial [Dialister sp.]|uniref:hypothetical protein n=1 Tax=Dialister sp. TaxID=1955814 RepID=UPI0025E7431A